MRWGNDRIDQSKIPGFLVSTVEGYPLYVKYGFKEVGRWEVDMERWPELGLKGKYMNAYLVRYPMDAASA